MLQTSQSTCKQAVEVRNEKGVLSEVADHDQNDRPNQINMNFDASNLSSIFGLLTLVKH